MILTYNQSKKIGQIIIDSYRTNLVGVTNTCKSAGTIIDMFIQIPFTGKNNQIHS